MAFHETLCELSGNKKLLEVHHRLEGEIGRFQSRTLALRGSIDDSLTEHRAILAAIRLRDVERAAELTADHVRVPAQRLQAALRDDALEAGASLAEVSPAAVSRDESSGAGASRARASAAEEGLMLTGFRVTRAGAILAVADFASSLRFYRDQLGLTEVARYEDPPYATLTAAGARISLAEQDHPAPDRPGVMMSAPMDRSRANVVLVLEVDDAQAARQELEARGSVPGRDLPPAVGW